MTKRKCTVCDAHDGTVINTYKHYAFLCKACGSVSHYKKDGKYFLEMIFLDRIFSFLPEKAKQRLFHASPNFNRSSFYDTYVKQIKSFSKLRHAECRQLSAQLESINLDPKGLRVLDVSGGPGLVAQYLQTKGAEVVVSEFSPAAVDAMKNELGVQAIEFDYDRHSLPDLVHGKFDIIMLRSSIIFCNDLKKLVEDINSILNDDGIVIVETILPTLGEILFWQQMEYKFPVVYSEEMIYKTFNERGLFLKRGYHEVGSYFKLKARARNGVSYALWSFLIDIPMVLVYRSLSIFKRVPIDSSLNHKMLTVIFSKSQTPHMAIKFQYFDKPVSTHFNIVNENIKEYIK